MTNEYMTPEVIEIGEATEVILGAKFVEGIDDNGEDTLTDSELDD
jgi:hypothetical protein